MHPVYINTNTGEVVCQEELFKYSLLDGKRRWNMRRQEVDCVCNIVECYDSYKAAKIRDCGTFLTFAVKSDGKMRLKHANFCRIRVCPMCTWRRSLKLGGQMNENYKLQVQRGYKHIMLTLTVRNVCAPDLSSAIDYIITATDRMHHLNKFTQSIIGYMRSLEITYNQCKDTYHPHLHYLLTVPSDYFDFRGKYLTMQEMRSMWMQSVRADYEPSTDLHRVAPRHADQTITGAIAEVSKYPSKATSFLNLRSRRKQIEVCQTIDNALYNRRLVAFGGVTRQIRAELKQADIDDNLVNLSDDNVDISETEREMVYVWRSGLYIPMEFEPISNSITIKQSLNH